MRSLGIETIELKTFKECDDVLAFFKDYPFLEVLREDKNRQEYVEKILKSGHILVCYRKDQPGGFITFYCNDKESKMVYISYLALNDKIGMAKGIVLVNLFTETVRIAHEDGMEFIRLEVDKKNARAKALYENAGFRYTSEETDHSVFMEMTIEKAVKRIEGLKMI